MNYLILVLILLIPILAIVLESPVGRALAGRLDRNGLGTGADVVAGERLSYLEGEFERLTSEVRRLEEESQFLNKLLTERPASEALPPGDPDA